MAEVRDFNSYKARGGRKRKGRRAQIPEVDTEPQFSVVPSYEAEERTAPQSDGRSYQDRIRTHRIIVFLRRVLICALIIAAVIAIYFSWRDRHFEEIQITKSVHLADSAGTTSTRLKSDILQYSKDGVRLLNADGDPLWNQTYEMQNPIARICRGVVAIGDYNGHHIYVAGTEGPLGQIDTNLPIRDFCVSAQGVVGAVLDGQDVTWIYLYDAKGQALASFKTTMKDSGYPISVSISPSGELVCVSYLYPEGGDVKTSVAFFNFGAVGQNATDNYASGYDYPGEVAPLVQFMNDKAAFALTNKRIMFYAGSEVPTSQTERFTGEEEVRSVYSNEQYVGLVYSGGEDGAGYKLQVYNTSGTLILTRSFDMDYSEILFDDDQITIYNENEFLISDFAGNDKFAGTFPQGVRAMIPTSMRSRYILVTGSEIQTMELR
ncbi:MAG: hypothetical protein IJT34_05395 [Butyrivibrio sp.]|nr:hypothetical protein [Butyrivibrio sp.]